MPTNKLWIEHTERAAWQSVQALREKLAEAEARAERMAPPAEGWRELLDALDAARASHALSGGTYAELIRGAVDRLGRAEAERRALEARLAGTPAREHEPVRAPEPRRRRRERAPAWSDEDDDGRPSPDERRLFGEIQKRARDLERERPRPDLDRRLHEIETRLADLPELDPSEVLDIAADLGALALRLRPASPRDDD